MALNPKKRYGLGFRRPSSGGKPLPAVCCSGAHDCIGVQESGFGVEDLRCRVQDLGFRT